MLSPVSAASRAVLRVTQGEWVVSAMTASERTAIEVEDV